MLVLSSFRLYSKWLKIHNTNKSFVSNLTFPYGAAGKKILDYISDLPQIFGISCSWQQKGSDILFGTGSRNFSTGSVSPCVGEKVVIHMTVTEEMVKCFAQATGDWNPIHFDSGKLDAASEIGKCNEINRVPVVHGALLNGIVSGVIGTQLPGPGTVVVSQVYKFPAPLYVGSQVTVEVEVMDFRRREVNVRYKVVSIPNETVVMDGTARLMVPKGRVGKVS